MITGAELMILILSKHGMNAALVLTLMFGQKIAKTVMRLTPEVTVATGITPTGIHAVITILMNSHLVPIAVHASVMMALALRPRPPKIWAVTTALGTGPTKTHARMATGTPMISPLQPAALACEMPLIPL